MRPAEPPRSHGVEVGLQRGQPPSSRPKVPKRGDQTEKALHMICANRETSTPRERAKKKQYSTGFISQK